MQHHFNTEIATKYGINIAIFLDHMAFWITKNLANSKNIHDGAVWTYNSVEALSAIFPYLSTKQLRKVLSDCKKYGLIHIGNYNETKYDRKQWYSLTDLSAKLLNISILPKGQMDCDKRANPFVQKGKPIADTITVTNTDRETARKKREPLSENYEPSKGMQAMSNDVATKCGIETEKLLAKFKNLMRSNGKVSADWDAEYGLFLQRERPAIQKPINIPKCNQETRNTTRFWEPGNPDYDRVHGVTHANGSEISRNNAGRGNMRKAESFIFQGSIMD